MKVDLPARFVDKMKELLGDEFEPFMASYEAPRVFGLRVNPLKMTLTEWKSLSFLDASSRAIPWTADGFYYSEEDRPGKHPYYHAGLYYIQEPSAMLPAELLDARPGHRVLDLCAAPGGKTTQLAGKLSGQGVLVTNDNAAERTKALAKNVELAGVRNAVILNEEPASIAEVFPEWFDRILVDAPCSGEGMFRKDDSMIGDWEKHSVLKCSAMQRDILRHSASMLAPGGLLLYSTCTFSPEENESQIASFLAENPQFAVEPIVPAYGLEAGRPEWIDEETARRAGAEIVKSLEGTVRAWPHRIEGEGHFVALLRKEAREKKTADDQAMSVGEEPSPNRKEPRTRRKGVKPGSARTAASASAGSPKELWEAFCKEHLNLSGEETINGALVQYGERVYLQPHGVPALDGLRVVRAGWYIGEAKRNRFVPSQALAMGLRAKEAARSLDLEPESEDAIRYLRGETLFVAKERIVLRSGDYGKAKGYILVCISGRPIGWGKYESGMLKNELSPGWRRS
ncbi:RsmB/NOP family class I SAM-dependent RNA methyltransferase [Paenibacillus sp. LHD-117]|uniref:RsmB/NOP family class I SAM-dependent RNA methyltransferase n=1 Tax=Paenibacillus sp. LHD-117 TaxID=3071412 RepID=UPI0027E07A30|nr:RsmB/NOP family class I SAM-dependent RNA methyltransferase [Paenibacillus sp. LHD-117]MDQ6423311.1 RsmB/NOP family class I SAM-dependent RNA methyltransferase [Paenibacillus sp. LHD-117]